MRMILTTVLFALLAVYPLVSTAAPGYQTDTIYDQPDKLETPYVPQPSVSESFTPFTESSRIGSVSGDVAEYKIRIKVGPGEYDSITLTNYVQEKWPWRINTDKNLVILPGHALTEKFYSGMAIYYAQQGYSAYVLDRRETNIPIDETDLSCMENWTFDEYLKDTFIGINASRNHTSSLSGKSVEYIPVTAIGHSHGALILTAYEASDYDEMPSGSVDKIVPVDIIIAYNPSNSELIQDQTQEFNAITGCIENGIYNEDNMANMIYIAYLASTAPDDEFYLQPELTNRQFFRAMASQTYSFSLYPYTPDYHYWSGDLGGLYYVDEDQLLNLTLSGGAVPYTPKYLDQYMAGLMGNVEGYEIDSSRIDSPVLYVGLGGGFGEYGSWWYENEVRKTNKRVTSINWNNQGHASLLIDHNSNELWTLIDSWVKNDKNLTKNKF